jgi:hypothetical protein
VIDVGCEAVFVPAVTIEYDRDLQQCENCISRWPAEVGNIALVHLLWGSRYDKTRNPSIGIEAYSTSQARSIVEVYEYSCAFSGDVTSLPTQLSNPQKHSIPLGRSTLSDKTDLSGSYITDKTKLRGLSPRANYTDRATATYRRS